ncbi:MAG: hypothetical protein EZS28_028272, partial [Streblomastix strix]
MNSCPDWSEKKLNQGQDIANKDGDHVLLLNVNNGWKYHKTYQFKQVKNTNFTRASKIPVILQKKPSLNAAIASNYSLRQMKDFIHVISRDQLGYARKKSQSQEIKFIPPVPPTMP